MSYRPDVIDPYRRAAGYIGPTRCSRLCQLTLLRLPQATGQTLIEGEAEVVPSLPAARPSHLD